MEDTKDTRPSRHDRVEEHVNSLSQHTEDQHRPTTDGIPARRGEIDTSPTYNPESISK